MICMRSKWGSLERRGQAWDARYIDPVTRKPRRRKVGTVAELGEVVDDATRDAILERLRAEVTKTLDPEQSFLAFLDGYEDTYRLKVKEATFATTMPQMRRVARMLGDRAMHAVDVATAERIVLRIARGQDDKRPSPNTVRLHIHRLCAMWERAKRAGVVSDNPWRKVEKPRERIPSTPSQRASLGAILSAVQAIRETDRGVDRDMLRRVVVFVAETGVRIGEAAALTWNDVERGKTRVVIHDSKNGKKRSLRLSKLARDFMPKKGREVLVFPNLRTRGRQSYLLKLLRDACDRAGVPRMTWRDLRHCLGTRLAAANRSAKQISKVLGNSEEMSKRYADHDPDRLADLALEELARHEGSSSASSRAG